MKAQAEFCESVRIPAATLKAPRSEGPDLVAPPEGAEVCASTLGIASQSRFLSPRDCAEQRGTASHRPALNRVATVPPPPGYACVAGRR
jgi:hypothetical protein